MLTLKKKIHFLAVKAWAHRLELGRYFVVGSSAFILDMSSLYVIKEHFNLQPVQAVVINQAFILAYVFLLNKKWSFGSTGQTHTQLMRFLILAGSNYLISIAWMWFFAHYLPINYLITRILNIILAMSWNFLLYKYWVYRVKPTPELTHVYNNQGNTP